MRARALGIVGVLSIAVSTACGSEINVFQTPSGGAGGGGVGGSGPGAGSPGGAGPTTTSSVGGAGPGGEGPGGQAAGGQSAGGQGGGLACTDDRPCEIDAVCSEGYCDLATNTCAVAPLPAGSPCGDGSCDGSGSCATGDFVWAKGFGDSAAQLAYEVASDGQGNVIATGIYTGSIDFGGGLNVSGQTQDAWLAKLDPQGAHLWSYVFPGPGADWAWDVVTDASNNVYVLGYFNDTISIVGNVHTSAGQRDIFVAKLDPMGNLVWSKRYGGSADELPHTIAVSASGSVAIGGYFYDGTLSFGPGIDHPAAGDLDPFVAVLDANGDHVWSDRFGDASEQRAFDLAFDGPGNLIMTGYFLGTADFGGVPITSGGQADAFIAKFDASGNHVFSAGYGGAGNQAIQGLAIDAQNDIVVSGYAAGSIDFGGGVLSATPGGFDAFVARLAPSGAHLDSAIYNGPGSEQTRDLEIDAQGHIVFVGYSNGNPDFGGGPITTQGSDDVIVVKLTSDFTHLWSHAFGDFDTQIGHGIAVDPTGSVFVAGYFEDFLDFGGGPLQAVGQEDAFLAKLSP